MFLLAFGISVLSGIEEHPAMIQDKETLRKLYFEQVKKKTKPDVVWSKHTDDLGKVRTPSGLFWQPPRATIFTKGFWAALTAANDVRLYNDSSSFEKLLETVETGPCPTLTIFADLWSWPGINDLNNSINRLADESEVKRVKFVLLTDDVPPKILKPIAVENNKEQEVNGEYGIPEFHTINSTTTATATSNSGARATINEWSTVQYKTVSAQHVQAFNANYRLVFKILDDKGVPIIRKENKKLIFKVIRPTGEWTVKWNLASLNKF